MQRNVYVTKHVVKW